jgi:hypothetical protein
MAKLPDNFVKAPAATSRLTISKPTAGKEARRKAKRGGLDLEAATEHVYDVLVHLSQEEHQALAAACDALAAVGERVSVEQMIKQVITRWMAATRAVHAAEPHEPPRPVHDAIASQLRKLAEQPLRRWRELNETVRRWSRVFAGTTVTPAD